MTQTHEMSNLVEKIQIATKSGKVRWQFSSDEHTFETPFNNGAVLIAQQLRNEAEESLAYTFTVHNNSGVKIAEQSFVSGPVFEMLESLYQAAEETASWHSEGTLASLEDELDTLLQTSFQTQPTEVRTFSDSAKIRP